MKRNKKTQKPIFDYITILAENLFFSLVKKTDQIHFVINWICKYFCFRGFQKINRDEIFSWKMISNLYLSYYSIFWQTKIFSCSKNYGKKSMINEYRCMLSLCLHKERKQYSDYYIFAIRVKNYRWNGKYINSCKNFNFIEKMRVWVNLS